MRYIIGIDLGTTNSCVAYIDTHDVKAAVQLFKIPQLIAEGVLDSLSTLPSFCYLAAAHELTKAGVVLPWQPQANFAVGSCAAALGAKVPTRLVQSAKSWLCHSAANRRDKILPIEAADESGRISPVEATARYLRHIREAWNYAIAKGDVDAEFEAQEIVLTVPASFDEVARALTVEAARLAGFVQMTLLEEPQAAFYSWIAQHESDWEKLVAPGSTILVCDVGGGTTDFSLIDVVAKDDKAAFQRMAVGNHLLLGGDNMDAAIVHCIDCKMAEKGHELSSLQRQQLKHEARKAKEALLQVGKESIDSYRVLLQGTGSSVVQGTIAVELTKTEVQKLLLEGFFGQHSWEDALKLRKTAGFRTMGLPYEDEPSITKHLAHFLAVSGTKETGPKRPNFILFNGGTMKPQLFQDELVKALKSWFPETGLQVLPSFHLDLAVARGAAYFGKARRGLGVKIGGGVARGYYLVIDTQDTQGAIIKKALSVLPRGSDEGVEFEPDTTFMLTPNTPVSFQLATSNVRLHDALGDLVTIDPLEMHLLPPIHTILRFGKKQTAEASSEKIPIRLHIAFTTIGTLEISLKSLKTDHQWGLEFQMRSASGQDDSLAKVKSDEIDQTFQKGHLKAAEELILQVFGPQRGALKPERLMEKLEEGLTMPRRDWSTSILRGLADCILKGAPSRKVSAEYGVRWWNTVGFMMRPGFGYPLDDFRLKELWKIILSDFKGMNVQAVQLQMWICYRRVAGGLNKGQQTQLASDLVASLLPKKIDKFELKSKAEGYAYSEKIRALAAFELLEIPLKIRLGNALVHRIMAGEGSVVDFWALGRIGARQLLYGSLANVVPTEQCQKWIEQLLQAPIKHDAQFAFLCGQLARKTEHREINVSAHVVDLVLKHFADISHIERLQELLLKENHLTQSEQEQAFGEGLPAGLMLVHMD